MVIIAKILSTYSYGAEDGEDRVTYNMSNHSTPSSETGKYCDEHVCM